MKIETRALGLKLGFCTLILVLQCLTSASFVSPAQAETPEDLASPAFHESLVQSSAEIDWDRSITESIVIHAPLQDVWRYASDSSRAREWSVYFDHITPLQAAGGDGGAGAVRRCFRFSDERGPSWDELVFDVKPFEMRQLWVHHLENYHPGRVTRQARYFVRQLYKSISAGETRMTFQTQVDPSLSPEVRLFFRLGSRQVARTFALNLENIKAAIEEGQTFARPHPWRKPRKISLESIFTNRD